MSEAAAKAPAWVPPEVDGPVVGRRRSAEGLNAIERDAWDAGHVAGREAGMAAVRQEESAQLAELRRSVQRLGAILHFMSRPLQELDAEVERQLAQLVGAVASQVVRRELKAQPEQIIAVIRETVTLLPAAAREVRVHLNPADAALVRAQLQQPDAEAAWTIIEDPVLSRGGCRVTTENSTIDARVEQRLGAAIAALLGDERSSGGGRES